MIKNIGANYKICCSCYTISSNPVAAEWAIPPDLSDGQNFLHAPCCSEKGCLAALQFWYPFSCFLFHSDGKIT